jgi:hypothetical protein
MATMEQIKMSAIEKARLFYAGNETAIGDLEAVLAKLDDSFWRRFLNSAYDQLIDQVSIERKARVQRTIRARQNFS